MCANQKSLKGAVGLFDEKHGLDTHQYPTVAGSGVVLFGMGCGASTPLQQQETTPTRTVERRVKPPPSLSPRSTNLGAEEFNDLARARVNPTSTSSRVDARGVIHHSSHGLDWVPVWYFGGNEAKRRALIGAAANSVRLPPGVPDGALPTSANVSFESTNSRSHGNSFGTATTH